MMRSAIVLFLLVLSAAGPVQAQYRFRCTVLDSADRSPVAGATVLVAGTTIGAVTDGEGRAEVIGIPAGARTIIVSSVGHRSDTLSLLFPAADDGTVHRILLASTAVEMEGVTVTTMRTNARIEDLPQKVEVLGMEEMDEESSLVPGNIGSILGDIAVITIQRTNPVNGNDAVRMMGLDPQYTQMMRDGLPLYGGFSGSLGVLSIPPLDLKQVEIIKGSVSTLYGGGAIAGLINFISREPEESLRVTLLLNRTSQRESDADIFLSNKNDLFGYTLFAAASSKPAMDVNNDGFAEIPKSPSLTLHPRFFIPLSATSRLTFGAAVSGDRRTGGDITAVNDGASSVHPYLRDEWTRRTTVDLQYTASPVEGHALVLKTAASGFRRSIEEPGFHFTGRQNSSYSEVSDLFTIEEHTIVAGVSGRGEMFRKEGPDTLHVKEYDHRSVGLFVQDGWQLMPSLMLELGLRLDRTNQNGSFFLPRAALFYTPDPMWSIRLSAGRGYVVPTILSYADPEPSLTEPTSSLSAERSLGVNADVRFHRMIGDVDLEIDQAFYYTQISDAVEPVFDLAGHLMRINSGNSVFSAGSDTYLRAAVGVWEFYLGYNHTETVMKSIVGPNTRIDDVLFSPNDKASATVALRLTDTWRCGWEAAYTANQSVTVVRKAPDFLFMAAMTEWKSPIGVFVLNVENLLDERQSRHEPLVYGTTAAPVFAPIWGPVEGRVVNVSYKTTL